MPTDEIILTSDLKPTEVVAKNRIESALNQSTILMDFFNRGFTEYVALRAIVKNYYPEINESHLSNFWNFRRFDEAIYDALKSVLTKIES